MAAVVPLLDLTQIRVSGQGRQSSDVTLDDVLDRMVKGLILP